ncbi:MAG: polyphosphate kinase 1 [Rhodothermaceae bacterium]
MTQEFIDRELSWLSFNFRVLQEAKDPAVPLYDKIKFLAIYSSNLDEFFRVRVAALRHLLTLKSKAQSTLKFTPEELLDQIQTTVGKQLPEYGRIYRNIILKELKENKIFLVDDKNINEEQLHFIEDYFDENIRHHIQPAIIDKEILTPFLRNQRLYLTLRLSNNAKDTDYKYVLVEIPSNHLPRFVILPSPKGEHHIIFLDDMIRVCLQKLFVNKKTIEAYSVKLTRDAELYIEDEFEGNLLKKIQKSIKKRNTGVPSRFLYDKDMPESFRNYLMEALNLTNDDMVEGGRYHSFSDLFSFPNPSDKKLEYEKLPVLPSRELDEAKSVLDFIENEPQFLYFPYNSYDNVIRFFKEASQNPDVVSIKVTQYRVAKHSAVVKSLINAAKNGIDVTVFVEIKARFDEEQNIIWASKMEKAGVKVIYSFPGLKVHAKLALVTKKIDGSKKQYAYLSTGNFNENTSKIYTDLGYFTTDPEITSEIDEVFEFLATQKETAKFKHLLVAQFNMRSKFNSLIKKEIENAQAGKPAYILAKMNSLEDRKIIRRLYEASQAGVKIDLIIRGICCLNPGVKGLSENIRVISIIDRFLEHSRFYYFHNNGNELLYAASADWMKRNLSRRVEVGFPVRDKKTKSVIKEILDLQLKDNTKARIIDEEFSNRYVQNEYEKINSQTNVIDILKKGAE